MSMRDFVDPSCGVPNAMSNLARGTAEMASHIQEARAFDGGLKGVERGPGGPPMEMLANAPPLHAMGPGADVDAFMHQFQQGPKMGVPPARMHRSGIPYFAPPPPMFDEKMAMPRMPPPHMMHGPMHSRPLDVDSMVNEFSQMGMHGPPQDEFERIFNNSFHGPPPPHMLHARAHMPPHMMEPLRTAVPPPAVQIAPAPPSVAELESAYQEAIAGPPPVQAEAVNPWAAEFEQMNQFRERMGQAPVQAPPTEADLEDAYAEATSEKPAWVDEFLNEQTSRPAEGAGGMSMGMDKDLVDRLLASGNPKWQNSKFLNLLQKVSRGQVEFKDGQIHEKPGPAPGDDWASEFQQSQRPLGEQWAGEFERMQPPQHQHQQEWVREFEDAHPELYGQDEKVDAEFDTTRGAAWADELAQEEMGAEDYGDFDWQDALQRAREAMPAPKDPEYKFDPNNPFMDHPDPLSEGLRLLKEGALKDAILAFEAAVQKDPNNSEAWRFLGQAQAENEAETQAISALLKAISVDPYNLDALMMLGVSYTNDLDESRALNYLKTWLQNHPDYQHGGVKLQQANLAEYEELYGGGHMGHMGSLDNTLHNEVTKMFLQAVQMNPQDADLHAVLGVLYHISNDFDKAIDAFQHAVQLRPDDAQLWNKLGATQANSSRSAEAIEAYKRALALKPNYVRALANLAISYANLGMHDEASRTYLMTLKQNPNAEHVWGYLRMSLAQLGRDALVEVAKQKNVEAFRPYFEF